MRPSSSNHNHYHHNHQHHHQAPTPRPPPRHQKAHAVPPSCSTARAKLACSSGVQRTRAPPEAMRGGGGGGAERGPRGAEMQGEGSDQGGWGREGLVGKCAASAKTTCCRCRALRKLSPPRWPPASSSVSSWLPWYESSSGSSPASSDARRFDMVGYLGLNRGGVLFVSRCAARDVRTACALGAECSRYASLASQSRASLGIWGLPGL